MPYQAHQRRILAILALTQIISWGSLYYAFSILAPEIRHELGWRAETVFGAFSWSLLVAGLASTPAGMLIDRHGGKPVMGSGSLFAAIGFALLSASDSIVSYYIAWTLLGIAMALVLYEAAFATINRECFEDARRGISLLTLFGGLASTVFWPVTFLLNQYLGWRASCMAYALIHLLLCFPAHLLLTNASRSPANPAAIRTGSAAGSSLTDAIKNPSFWKLAFAFSANLFVFSALSVHLIPILGRLGHDAATVILLAAMIGPMQVAGRIMEMASASRTSPQQVGKVVFAMLPAALLALIFFGSRQWAIALFCVLYGLGNGVLTIVRGTIPLALFGRENYGAIAGAMAGPALAAKAAGPLVIAVVIEVDFSPRLLLGVLLLAAAAALICYHAAINSSRINACRPLQE